jgi:hypothetical protein
MKGTAAIGMAFSGEKFSDIIFHYTRVFPQKEEADIARTVSVK